MREKWELNRGWRFSECFKDEMAGRPMEGGTAADLPHTVKETPFHYFDEGIYQMVSCYQKTFTAPADWAGKRVTLTFEGAAHHARVWLNGELLGEHASGYTAFSFEIGGKLRLGEENLLSVRLDSRESLDQPPFGFVIDYMTYGGLYRGVHLTVQDPVCLTDIFAMPSVETVNTECFLPEDFSWYTAGGSLKTLVRLSDEAAAALREGRISLRQTLNGEEIFSAAVPKDTPLREDRVLPVKVTRELSVRLWDVESPVLYTLRTVLYEDGEEKDAAETVIGFRKAEFKKDGFFLNGRHLKIRGLNRHQSFPYVGYAMPRSLQEEDARLLKEELCVNAVRTSHYPQGQDFVNACDRQGLLVFTEIPGWQHIGGAEWKKQALRNVQEMVTQYRNHPSVILWGVRINESRDCDELYEQTNGLAHALDSTRPTGGVRCELKMHLLEDVYTYNDFSYDGDRKASGTRKKKDVTTNMEKPYMVTEYAGHMYPTKAFDWEEHRLEQLYRHAKVLDSAAADDELCGSFGWCMFDYNTHKDFGSGDRICYHGVMDMFRNPKEAASLYAAQGDAAPVLTVTSSMDIGEHPASVRGETYIVSNADSVRMYKNGSLLKEYTRADSDFVHLQHGPMRITDYVGDGMIEGEGFDEQTNELVKTCLNETAIHGYKMTPKVMQAAARLMAFHHLTMDDAKRLFEAYVGDWGGQSKVYRFDAVKDGKVVKTVVKTPMQGPVRLEAVCSTPVMTEEETYAVCAVRVRAVDENGNVLPFFAEAVEVRLTGPGRIIGPSVFPLRGGMAGTYVRTTGESGTVTLTLTAAGAESVSVELKAEKANVREL